MKKCAFFLVLVLLLGLCSCTGRPTAPTVPVLFYYPRSEIRYRQDDGVITAEQREAAGHEDDFSYLFQSYLQGPDSQELSMPFPKGLTLDNYLMTDTHLYITLTGGLESLSGIELTVACACIAKTCFALTGVEYVEISTPEASPDSFRTITIRADALFLEDDSVSRLRQSYSIYRTDLQRRFLIEESVTVQQDSSEEICASLVRALMQDTHNDLQLSPLPDGTELLGIRLKNNLCTVDLSHPFLSNAFSDTAAQRTTLQAIVNTLTQLPYVDSVEFTVNGDPLTHYRLLDLRTAWVWDDSAVGPVRTADGQVDATLYVLSEQTEFLLALPVIVDPTPGTTPAALLAETLLNFSYQNGYVSPIPADTRLLDINIQDAVCTVTVSKAFLSQPDQLTLAARSLIATLCSLKDISQVQIAVEGVDNAGVYGTMFTQPTAPEKNWFG